eukprot:sb/3461906/
MKRILPKDKTETTKKTPITSPPVQKKTSVTSPPVQKKTSITSPPVQKKTSITSPPVQKMTSITSPPVQRKTSITSPPVQKKTSITSPPVQKKTSVTSPPVQKKTSVTSPPVQRKTSVTKPPVQKKTSITSPPVQKKTSVTSPPAQRKTSITSPPVHKKTSITSPPIQRKSSVSKPPIKKKTSVTKPPVDKKTSETGPPVKKSSVTSPAVQRRGSLPTSSNLPKKTSVAKPPLSRQNSAPILSPSVTRKSSTPTIQRKTSTPTPQRKTSTPTLQRKSSVPATTTRKNSEPDLSRKLSVPSLAATKKPPASPIVARKSSKSGDVVKPDKKGRRGSDGPVMKPQKKLPITEEKKRRLSPSEKLRPQITPDQTLEEPLEDSTPVSIVFNTPSIVIEDTSVIEDTIEVTSPVEPESPLPVSPPESEHAVEPVLTDELFSGSDEEEEEDCVEIPLMTEMIQAEEFNEDEIGDNIRNHAETVIASPPSSGAETGVALPPSSSAETVIELPPSSSAETVIELPPSPSTETVITGDVLQEKPSVSGEDGKIPSGESNDSAVHPVPQIEESADQEDPQTEFSEILPQTGHDDTTDPVPLEHYYPDLPPLSPRTTEITHLLTEPKEEPVQLPNVGVQETGKRNTSPSRRLKQLKSNGKKSAGDSAFAVYNKGLEPARRDLRKDSLADEFYRPPSEGILQEPAQLTAAARPAAPTPMIPVDSEDSGSPSPPPAQFAAVPETSPVLVAPQATGCSVPVEQKTIVAPVESVFKPIEEDQIFEPSSHNDELQQESSGNHGYKELQQENTGINKEQTDEELYPNILAKSNNGIYGGARITNTGNCASPAAFLRKIMEPLNFGGSPTESASVEDIMSVIDRPLGDNELWILLLRTVKTLQLTQCN